MGHEVISPTHFLSISGIFRSAKLTYSCTPAICITTYSFNQGKLENTCFESLTHELLQSNKCYLLDGYPEMYVWMVRSTSLQERKAASEAAEKLLIDGSLTRSHVIKVIEGFETIMFKSKFSEWPATPELKLSSEDGRGKVAALLKSQGLDVKGLMKAAPVKEEPEPYIDCTGHLQVERVSAMSLASKMVSAKFQAVQARLFEGKEPLQFFVIFQSFQVFKGGLSSGYKNFVAQNGIDEDTYSEAGLALFRVEGSGSENMQALQVDSVASSLNSSFCYFLLNGNTVFTWTGNLTTSLDHDLVERKLDVIKFAINGVILMLLVTSSNGQCSQYQTCYPKDNKCSQNMKCNDAKFSI